MSSLLRRNGLFLGPFLVVVLLLSLGVAGHAPSDPRDFETRLLTDQNDDCGGHGQEGCRGTHDLLALGLREAFIMDGVVADGFTGDQRLVWSLWMAPGAPEGETFVDTIAFEGPDGEGTIRVTTTEDATFEVEADGFVEVDGPYPLLLGGEPDGQRFGIDIHIDRAAAGLAEGDTLRDFRVTATVDGTTGDIMSGTSITEDGSEAPKADNERDAPAETVRPNYLLDGPGGYLDVDAPVDVSAAADAPFETTVSVENEGRDTAQEVTLVLEAPEGRSLRFQEADDEGGAVLVVTLDPRASADVAIAGPVGAEPRGYTFTVHHATDAGGLGSATVPVERTAGERPPQDKAEEGPSPGGLAVVLVTLAGLRWARRGAE